MTKVSSDNNKTKRIAVVVGIFVLVGVILAIAIGVRYYKKHQSPNDIKSFVISNYNGTQLEDAERSQTLTITPTSCELVVMSPTDGNYAPTTPCTMNKQLWDIVTNAYFTGSFPTEQFDQTMSPVTGPLVLLGVYYTDGTSNTVYFSRPLPANFQSFLDTLKTNQITNTTF